MQAPSAEIHPAEVTIDYRKHPHTVGEAETFFDNTENTDAPLAFLTYGGQKNESTYILNNRHRCVHPLLCPNERR